MDRIKILAVDDEPSNLAIIKATFPEYDITTETSPWEVERLIKTGPYDVFIIDYLMPNINGIELLDVIKERYEGKPYTAVLSTAYGTTHLFEEDFKDGLFHFFLEKPVELPSLKRLMKEIIKQVMERRNAR